MVQRYISDEQRAEIAAGQAADAARRAAEARKIMSGSRRNPARSAGARANPSNRGPGGQPAPRNTEVTKPGTGVASAARRRELRIREMAGMGSQSTDDHQ